MTLQTPSLELTFELAVQWTLIAVLTAMGLAIILIAFRGYRRNRSRPMLFIALGFAAIVLPEVLVLIVSVFVEQIPEFLAITTIQLTNVFAFACILYAITMEP
ncbi:DUF5985 family protein [Halobacteria archaeon AArc-dxtr1]|nr:DUF5985 family protein [Halobacteria archaeon AArc-dxtr1]